MASYKEMMCPPAIIDALLIATFFMSLVEQVMAVKILLFGPLVLGVKRDSEELEID
jgi:hypothetical protein